jgi:hypothetical protein
MNALPSSQAHLVIVGATGMVGGYPCGTRSTTPHQDFADCSALADALSGQGAAVFCLGAYNGGGAGYGAPQGHRGLHNCVRASSPYRQPGCGLFLFKRQRCGPDWTKPAGLRALQGRGRERVACGGAFPRLHLPARLRLSGGAALKNRISVPLVARNLPCVSGAVPQSGDPGRRFGPRHGGCCRPQNSRARRPGFRKP